MFPNGLEIMFSDLPTLTKHDWEKYFSFCRITEKYVQFPIICSLQYSIDINTVEVDPHSDLLHIGIVKSKNMGNIYP